MMINVKFILTQFKNIWFILIIFFVIFAILIGITAIPSTFGDVEKGHIWGGETNSAGSVITVEGAGFFLNQIIFALPTFLVFFIFGIFINIMILNRDINHGHIISWMTTGMSRNIIFNSKLFVLLTSTFLVNLWIIIFEMILFSIRMTDFNLVVRNLLFGNLSLILYSSLIVSLSWFVFSLIKKTRFAFGILSALAGWLIFCQILISLSNNIPGFENLSFFKYLTIQTLLNSPLKFFNFETVPLLKGEGELIWESIAQLAPLKAEDFAWQLPLIFFASNGLFLSGLFIIKNKDFSF